MSTPAVFNMPSGVPFLPSLAKGLKEIHGDRLQDALILLPTRRAVRALGDAFVTEGSASLLPRMRPLADINPEEPPFEPGELAGVVTAQMHPMQRRFEMAKIITHYHAKTSDLPLDPAGALALADPLIAILDDASMEEADLSNIDKLKDIEAFAAAHFQNAAQLYKIIQTYWPRRLKEIGKMEPFARRVALLNALTELWTREPPGYPVVIAGSTGTLAASARLMRCVSRFRDGMIVLPGLNTSLPNETWDNVGLQHPQNSLKQLIRTIGIDPGDVPNWKYIAGDTSRGLTARRDIISESLVPVQDTGDWPARIATIRERAATGFKPFEIALKGLSIIEAANNEEEALTIAIILREVLSDPNNRKTAALVTPDPALARRVKARLRRWNVDVDYSQGEPLEETPLGAFLSSIITLTEDPINPVSLSVVFKHTLTAMGQKPGVVAQDWRYLERKHFRGIRPSYNDVESLELIKSLQKMMAPLEALSEAPVTVWAETLARVAESLSQTDESAGALRLWVNDAGEKAASLIEELMAHGDHLGDMSAPEFSKLLAVLMRGKVVRARFGTHPRLSILGPLEARMLNADLIILGGLNESIWPASPSIEPFLSRGMRQQLGLSLPERRFGLSAHDFAELAANPNVVLTRAERSDEGPMVASRWLWRLQTLLKGALVEKAKTALSSNEHYLAWARALDDITAGIDPAQRPVPKPPVDKRWPGEKGRELSVTQIRTWMRDPYAIYAKRILGLSPLDEMDMPLGPREFGNAIHKGLENFVNDHKVTLPPDAANELINDIKLGMVAAGFETYEISKDQTRLEKIADQMIEWIVARRLAGWSVAAVEKSSDIEFSDLNFRLKGKPDLIERGPLGFAVNDYKTGAPATIKVIKAGFDPQLPLTAFMLSEDAFGLGKGPTEELNYLRIKGSGHDDLVNPISPPKKDKQTVMDYAGDAATALRKLIQEFDKVETGYASQPRVQYVNDYGDYDHLARRDEWGLGSDGGGDGY